MKRETKDGQWIELFGQCYFRIIVGKREFKHAFKAGIGKRYTVADCEQMLENVVNYCEEKLPTIEFRMVQVLPNQFNLIAIGKRPRKGEAGEQNAWEKEVESAGNTLAESPTAE